MSTITLGHDLITTCVTSTIGNPRIERNETLILNKNAIARPSITGSDAK